MNLVCIACSREQPLDSPRMRCACGGLLEVRAAWQPGRAAWDARPLSVWRYRELLPDPGEAGIVTLGEGGTALHAAPRAAEYAGVAGLWVKNEGENPTGSFKDRGMTVGVSMARAFGHAVVGCASTGNTAASLAAYAARAGLAAVVLVPAGKVALGKLAQSVVHGAHVIAVRGGFDDALRVVDRLAGEGHLYLLNSVNPLRLEGQKTLVWEALDQYRALHEAGATENPTPDVVAYPVGNAGNISAAHKAMQEWQRLGLLDRVPRLVGVQAAGAAPLVRLYERGEAELMPEARPETVATAIRIGDPVSWPKAIRAVRDTDGALVAVSDEEILGAQAILAGWEGLFVEPASAASLAGVRSLVASGAIDPDESVVCVTTGHGLKDAQGVLDRMGAEVVEEVDASVVAVRAALERMRAEVRERPQTATRAMT